MARSWLSRFWKRLNVFARIDLLGHPEFYDVPKRFAQKAKSKSAQLFTFIYIARKMDFASLFISAHGGVARELLEHAINGMLYVGIAVFLAGWIVLVALSFFEYLSGSGWVSTSRLAKPAERRALYEMYKQMFIGHELMSFATFNFQCERNILSIFIVFKEKLTGDRDRLICGFFVMQYLSAVGLQVVLQGSKDGRYFDSEDLVPSPDGVPPATAEGLYVGAFGGRTLRDKASIMAEILRFARSLPVMRTFGRPATVEGKRIATKYGWQPILRPDGQALEIWEGQAPID